jgi:hypothetical protein
LTKRVFGAISSARSISFFRSDESNRVVVELKIDLERNLKLETIAGAERESKQPLALTSGTCS